MCCDVWNRYFSLFLITYSIFHKGIRFHRNLLLSLCSIWFQTVSWKNTHASFSQTHGFSESKGRKAFSRDIMQSAEKTTGKARLYLLQTKSWSTNWVTLFFLLGEDVLLYIKEAINACHRSSSRAKMWNSLVLLRFTVPIKIRKMTKFEQMIVAR